MAERMGCKDGKIVVICENFGKWYFYVVIFRVPASESVCVCLLGSTREAPMAHDVIDIFISLRHIAHTHTHFPLWTSLALSIAQNSTFCFLLAFSRLHSYEKFIRSFARVQIRKRDGNRTFSMPHIRGWCKREWSQRIACASCSMHCSRIKEITRWCCS